MLIIGTAASILMHYISLQSKNLLYLVIPIICTMIMGPYNLIGSAIASDIVTLIFEIVFNL